MSRSTIALIAALAVSVAIIALLITANPPSFLMAKDTVVTPSLTATPEPVTETATPPPEVTAAPTDTPRPTTAPTGKPTATPAVTVQPTPTEPPATSKPTAKPTAKPAAVQTAAPVVTAAPAPQITPAPAPVTAAPTPVPTAAPTPVPTPAPTPVPTPAPTENIEALRSSNASRLSAVKSQLQSTLNYYKQRESEYEHAKAASGWSSSALYQQYEMDEVYAALDTLNAAIDDVNRLSSLNSTTDDPAVLHSISDQIADYEAALS